MSARPEIKRIIFGRKITNIAGTAFLAEIMDYHPDLLTHPYQMGLPDKELEAVVAQLKDWGLNAIECYYPITCVWRRNTGSAKPAEVISMGKRSSRTFGWQNGRWRWGG